MPAKLPFDLRKLVIPVLVGFFVYLLPKPEMVDPKGWQLFSIFIGTIAGIILQPLPIPAVSLIALMCCVATNTLRFVDDGFQGFSEPNVWLIVFVFFISKGVIKTKLGHRITYSFVAILGKYTLGLGYGILLTELILAPFIPSNSARAGGIIYPIVKSIAETLGSRPEDGTARKLGSFLTLMAFQSNLIVSSMFVTAIAANSMAQGIAAGYGVYFSWFDWFQAAFIPGICSLIIVPLVLYIIYPPQLKVLPQALSIAKKNLHDMGSLTSQEWTMVFVFVSMMAIWIVGGQYRIPAASAGLFGVCVLLLTGVLSWKDMLDEHQAWSTMIWLAILIMMSGNFEKFGLINWFTQSVSDIFSNSHNIPALFGLSIIYFYSHYFFVSNTAHVSLLYGTFLSIAIAAGAPPLGSALLLGFFSSLFCSITHYSTGSAPIYFGMGYVQVLEWWLYGFIISVINIVIWLTIGYAWWLYLGIL